MTREILLLSDGRVVDASDFNEEAAANPPAGPDGAPLYEPVTVEQRRSVESYKVTMEIVSGKETLEGPFDWPGRYIPLVPVWGDIVHIDGRDEWSGMARTARDAQILYNVERSNFAEVVAKQPSAPFMYTPEQIAGFEREWRDLAVDNAPGLPYNNVNGMGPPQRQMPPQMSPGYMAALQLSSDDLKAVTGIYDASLGARSNETSGRAIMARKQEGDIANYDYQDNVARAILYTGIIINDLIPHIYDTERAVRILGEDGATDYVEVNKPVWNELEARWETVNDIRAGKYDVTVSTGPSYTTQRMETLDAMMQLAQSQGPMAMLAQYGVLKNMDTPGMEDVREGMRKILVMQGLLEPSEGDQPPAPPQPDPKDVAAAEKDAAQAAKYGAEAEGQQIQNMASMAMLQMPPPISPGYQPNPQPPEGGFFVPQPVPGGFPG